MKKIIVSMLLNVLISTLSMESFAHEGHEDIASEKTEKLTAAGKPVKSKKFDRVINITMNDQMKFQPENISVKKVKQLNLS